MTLSPCLPEGYVLVVKVVVNQFLLHRCLTFLLENEWQFRHAAENKYCPYCATDADEWTDQEAHRVGCPWVALVNDLREVLRE